jgi:hypothetical protein
MLLASKLNTPPVSDVLASLTKKAKVMTTITIGDNGRPRGPSHQGSSRQWPLVRERAGRFSDTRSYQVQRRAGRPPTVGSPGRRPFYLVPKIRCNNNVSCTL